MSSNGLDYEVKSIAQNVSDDSVNSAKRDQHSTSEDIQEKQDSVEALPDGNEPEYATGFRLFLIMFTIIMSTILTALEIGIISTAIPAITDEYHRIDDIGWYGSVTFLLAGPSAPLWGKLYKFLNVKWVFLASLAIYLIGSILAAAAPNSTSVIVGRAIQGMGGSGTLGGSILVINYVAQPKSRPMLLGTWMGTYMISTILGPLIGGAFTSGVGWRWCFWINLPLGGPVVVLVLLFLRIPKHIQPEVATWKEIILQLDLPGFSVLLASLVCLTLSLQWGGQTKTWNEGSVIATLILFIVFTVLFIVIEWMQADRAMAPLKLLQPRLTWANALYSYM
jgi:MFS family permease